MAVPFGFFNSVLSAVCRVATLETALLVTAPPILLLLYDTGECFPLSTIVSLGRTTVVGVVLSCFGASVWYGWMRVFGVLTCLDIGVYAVDSRDRTA